MAFDDFTPVDQNNARAAYEAYATATTYMQGFDDLNDRARSGWAAAAQAVREQLEKTP